MKVMMLYTGGIQLAELTTQLRGKVVGAARVLCRMLDVHTPVVVSLPTGIAALPEPGLLRGDVHGERAKFRGQFACQWPD